MEPAPVMSRPDAPASMTQDARKVWDELAPRLEAASLLGDIDGFALERYCESIVMWRAAKAAIYEKEWDSEAGRRVMLTVQQLHKICCDLEADFGLSPSDRASLAMPTTHGDKKTDKKPDRSKFFAS